MTRPSPGCQVVLGPATIPLIGFHLTCNSNVLKLWHQLAIKATHCVACQEARPLACQHLVDPVVQISIKNYDSQNIAYLIRVLIRAFLLTSSLLRSISLNLL